MFDDELIKKIEKNIGSEELKEKGINKQELLKVILEKEVSEYDDYGYIPIHQITPIERKISKLDNYTVVALFHHHFYLFPEVAHYFGDTSLVRNYTEVIQHLKYMNVNVVLHGHKHFALERPFITEDYYESVDSIIDVFAGGSVGTDRKEEHTFGVLDLYGKKEEIKLVHNKFVYNGENLEPIRKKQVPPKKMGVRIIKLIEMLKTINPEICREYENASEKAFKSYDSCSRVISWIGEIITGFNEVYKYLEQDYNNILFLLYAIQYRTICYMKIVGKEESYFNSATKIWEKFYSSYLNETEFNISFDKYHELFEHKRLQEIAIDGDSLMNMCANRKSQGYLAFSMLGIFFTDLYLILTKYADDFKESIKYKVNIKIEENKFHENVPAPRIVIHSDVDRRSVYIDLLCNDPTAHKMAVLFVKEFDLLINKFEDYFKLIGLKVYYLLPKIDRDSGNSTLDNYNFEAYIPTLIPLLTGDNIYSAKTAFARELIQNSIDAISVRNEKTSRDIHNEIKIVLDIDQNGKRYFQIKDEGTGMDRYKIERYFTSIGRSFYSSDEYEDMNMQYKPISNFGIGFLSSFMVCQEIDVRTKCYLQESEGLKLHIPNYDGCFFIEQDDEIGVGTEIKLYLEEIIDNKSIIDYIRKVMQDIKYDIRIQCLNEKNDKKEYYIPAHSIREQKRKEEFKFFIPFLDDGKVGEIDYEDVRTNKYINEFECGLLICKKNDLSFKCRHMILNSGIVVEQASINNVFEKSFGKRRTIHDLRDELNEIVVNFPASWLQLDVSRENVTGFSKMMKEKYSKRGSAALCVEIAEKLYRQLVQYIEYTKNKNTGIPAIYLQDVVLCALEFVGKQQVDDVLRRKILNLKYCLNIIVYENGVGYKLSRNNNSETSIIIRYENEKAYEKRISWIKRKEDDRKESGYWEYEEEAMINMKFIAEQKMLTDEMIKNKKLRINERIKHYTYSLLKGMEVEGRLNEKNKYLLNCITHYWLSFPDKVIRNQEDCEYPSMVMLEKIFMQHFCIGREDMQEVKITYDDMYKSMYVKEHDDKSQSS